MTFLNNRLVGGFLLVGALWLLGSCQSHPASPTNVPAVATPAVAKETPALKASIERVSIYPVPNRPADLAITLIVSVGNEGAPTFAQSWMLEVNSPGRRVPEIVPAVHISGVVELPGTNGVKTDLAKEDLATKTAGTPIPKAGRVQGVLTYLLPKTSTSDISNGTTTLVVQFTDADGKSYQTPSYSVGKKINH